MNKRKIHYGDLPLLKALSLLYGRNTKLLEFLIRPDLSALNATSEEIKREMVGFSTGEKLLIRIGLDIWDGSGRAQFNELYQDLDSYHFNLAIMLLHYLRSPPKEALLI